MSQIVQDIILKTLGGGTALRSLRRLRRIIRRTQKAQGELHRIWRSLEK